MIDAALDDPFRTAVLVSLFTDRRVAADDGQPSDDRRGWWADSLDPKLRIGSRLWLLLDRAKLTDKTPDLVRRYALEALQWLVAQGIAASVDAQAKRVGRNGLALSVQITKPRGDVAAFRWNDLWETLNV